MIAATRPRRWVASSATLTTLCDQQLCFRSLRMKLSFYLAVALLTFAPPLVAQESAPKSPRPITIDDFFQILDVAQPELSPDGQWVAYSVRTRAGAPTANTSPSSPLATTPRIKFGCWTAAAAKRNASPTSPRVSTISNGL